MKQKLEAPTVPVKKIGLTTQEAQQLYETVGFNELPHVEISLYWMFFAQFTGVMPYMLEIACVLALTVQSFVDFGIIAAILLSNAILGFSEELKAKASLVRSRCLFFLATSCNVSSLSLSVGCIDRKDGANDTMQSRWCCLSNAYSFTRSR